jgi:hypothetical protein
LDFKLLNLHLESFIHRINSVLLLFNLTRKDMLTHFKLRFNIRHSRMQVTLLRLLRWRLLYHSLRDNRYLTSRYGIFKIDNSRVKPREAHPLKCIFCSLVNFTLYAVIYDSIFNGWLVKLPDSLFAYLTKVSQWVKSLIGCC